MVKSSGAEIRLWLINPQIIVIVNSIAFGNRCQLSLIESLKKKVAEESNYDTLFFEKLENLIIQVLKKGEYMESKLKKKIFPQKHHIKFPLLFSNYCKRKE